MPVSRSELVAHLGHLRATLSAAGDGAANVWNEAVAALRDPIPDGDREWFADQVSDLGNLYGIPGIERAQTTRMLAAEGRVSWDDDQPQDGPLPHFSLHDVRPLGGVGNGAAGLAELLAGGGTGPWTWGYDQDNTAAWFSDARKGATGVQVREGLAVMAQELARLGLEFERGA
jgi:hypothetical protein